MATINPLITAPFDHNTDFTELADNCERFCEAMLCEEDPTMKIALCGRLAACLALLKPTLHEPIPRDLEAYLTVDSLPLHQPEFAPESDALCGYCEAITRLLISNTLAPDTARTMSDLLAELTGYFAERLKAPRWLTTDAGVEWIN